jgi:small ligand-binding sensory domain FIST
MIVTKAKGNVVEALGGKPPLLVLRELVQDMPESEQELLRNGLFLGKAISEYRETFGRGDFLVRNLTGADDSNGAVAVNGDMRIGQTVQFHVRDADTADEDLRELLAQHAGTSPAGALLFSCNGRGTRMFERPCHDVGVSRELLPATPVAGFFAAGELGPVGGDNFVHGHTASFAILREAR